MLWISDLLLWNIQGGSNMTGTDLCINKPHCDLERVKPQPPPSLLFGLEPVQSCLGVARLMSEDLRYVWIMIIRTDCKICINLQIF
jgi:hypothetical protein